MFVYLLLCVSACLHGAALSETVSLKEIIKPGSRLVEIDTLLPQMKHGGHLIIDDNWHENLFKSPYYIYSLSIHSFHPFGRGDRVTVDLRYLGWHGCSLAEGSIEQLCSNPPHPRTRVIVNDKAMDETVLTPSWKKGFPGITVGNNPALIMPADIARINHAWALSDQRSRLQIAVDELYNYRYYLAGATIAAIACRYMQNNHAQWVHEQLAEHARLIAECNVAQEKVDLMNTIIDAARNGSDTFDGSRIATAFDGIVTANNHLKRLRTQLVATSEWNLWDSMRKALKDNLGLLVKMFGAIWLADRYVLQRLLAYAPFEPPKIEVHNDHRHSYCGLLHHLWNEKCVVYSNAPNNYQGCWNRSWQKEYVNLNALLVDESLDANFAHNRKTAAGVVTAAFWASSFYAGRMLYRNADKLMAMLPKQS